MVSSSALPGLDRSPKENWVDKAGGLPNYIERIAKHLHYEKGMDIGHAIATAVNVVKKMCATGDINYPGKQNVNAGSRTEACAAVAQWEAKKASARVKTTDVRGRKLSDFEFAEVISEIGYKHIDLVLRASGASGSNRAFDESKYLRNPGNGKFSSKFTPTEMIAARRIVEGLITNLAVDQAIEFPGDAGWVKRSASGYLIQGPAGIRVVARTLSEAIEAAANIMAGKLSRIAEPTR